ncbi:Gfo/Idh/MocA family protein [Microbacterium sp. gxy059]|uniref:Gfo/Idh/MocA family protein n=1 Tax=Microbacterium sp. gxy059 TaxID=2957199 RepID=UPI003D951255
MTTPDTPLRAAFVGAGMMGRAHTTAARAARADLVAISSSRRSRAEEAAAELGVACAEPGIDEIVARDDIDVVHVCSPNALHRPQAEAAIAAGRHVICEKPLATAVGDAEALVAAARDAGVVGAVPFVYRYHPMMREARARIAAGEQTVLSVDARYLQDWMLSEDDENWRTASDAGGPSRAFADIGSHLFDAIEFVTGQRVARLQAVTRRIHDERGGCPVDTEDLAAVLFVLSGGAPGTALVSQVAAGRKNGLAIEVHGSRESYLFEQEAPETLRIGRREGTTILERQADLLAPDAARLCLVPSGHPMGYQDAFNAFVRDAYAAIRGETPEGLPTFADGLRAARLTEAVLASAATGDWIDTAE